MYQLRLEQERATYHTVQNYGEMTEPWRFKEKHPNFKWQTVFVRMNEAILAAKKIVGYTEMYGIRIISVTAVKQEPDSVYYDRAFSTAAASRMMSMLLMGPNDNSQMPGKSYRQIGRFRINEDTPKLRAVNVFCNKHSSKDKIGRRKRKLAKTSGE